MLTAKAYQLKIFFITIEMKSGKSYICTLLEKKSGKEDSKYFEGD